MSKLSFQGKLCLFFVQNSIFGVWFFQRFEILWVCFLPGFNMELDLLGLICRKLIELIHRKPIDYTMESYLKMLVS